MDNTNQVIFHRITIATTQIEGLNQMLNTFLLGHHLGGILIEWGHEHFIPNISTLFDLLYSLFFVHLRKTFFILVILHNGHMECFKDFSQRGNLPLTGEGRLVSMIYKLSQITQPAYTGIQKRVLRKESYGEGLLERAQWEMSSEVEWEKHLPHSLALSRSNPQNSTW